MDDIWGPEFSFTIQPATPTPSLVGRTVWVKLHDEDGEGNNMTVMHPNAPELPEGWLVATIVEQTDGGWTIRFVSGG